MSKGDVATDKVFSALADKNRRKIIELLHQKESTLLELADHFTISFQALSKHIAILERAALLKKKKHGKYRLLSLNTEALLISLQWISFYSNLWTQSFDQLEQLIAKNNDEGRQDLY